MFRFIPLALLVTGLVDSIIAQAESAFGEELQRLDRSIFQRGFEEWETGRA